MPDFNFNGFSDESLFDEWNEVSITDVDAKVTEEQV
jgi:hypothetical protein